MKEYKLPSGRASIEISGGLSSEKEFKWPSKASERNLALREALEQCLHISAQEGLARLQRDIDRESVKQLTAERDALAAQVEALKAHIARFLELNTLEDAVEWEHKCQAINAATPQQHLAEIRAQAVEYAADQLANLITAPPGLHSSAVVKLNRIAGSIRRGEVKL